MSQPPNPPPQSHYPAALALPPQPQQVQPSTQPATPTGYPQYPPTYYQQFAAAAYNKAAGASQPGYPYAAGATQQAAYPYPAQYAYPAPGTNYLNSPTTGPQSPYPYAASYAAYSPTVPQATQNQTQTTAAAAKPVGTSSGLALPATSNPGASSSGQTQAAPAVGSSTTLGTTRGPGRKPTTFKGAFVKECELAVRDQP